MADNSSREGHKRPPSQFPFKCCTFHRLVWLKSTLPAVPNGILCKTTANPRSPSRTVSINASKRWHFIRSKSYRTMARSQKWQFITLPIFTRVLCSTQLRTHFHWIVASICLLLGVQHWGGGGKQREGNKTEIRIGRERERGVGEKMGKAMSWADFWRKCQKVHHMTSSPLIVAPVLNCISF